MFNCLCGAGGLGAKDDAVDIGDERGELGVLRFGHKSVVVGEGVDAAAQGALVEDAGVLVDDGARAR